MGSTKKISTPKLVPADATPNDFKNYGKKALFLPVNIASIVIFRIAFGLIILWEVIRYFKKGFIESHWLKPSFLFTYWPFDFIKPLPGEGMYLLYYALGVAAFFIVIGLFYRVSMSFLFLGMTYSFLLDQSRYLNHMYLVCLICFIMIFIPANRRLAADSFLFKDRSDVVPAWMLWLLRFMIALPYFFGGIAKINGDWLRGEPLRTWLAFDTDFPVIGRYFTEDWMIYIMAYSGLLFDLLIIPALLFKRTRIWAFLFMILFNLMNAKLFEIGIFPWFMIFATTLFFHPSWPRKFLMKSDGLVISNDWNSSVISPVRKKLLLYVLGLWVVVHLFLPLRHLLIPGSVHWTEEGHRYAWHMKLRTKSSLTFMYIEDKSSGKREEIDPYQYLTSRQVQKMSGRPDMLWLFAQKLKRDYAELGIDVSVYADVKTSLNNRVYQQFVSPDLDLTSVKRPLFGHTEWIIPLKTPLNSRITNNENSGSED